MRHRLVLLLLPLALPGHAALPNQVGDAVLDVRLPALLQQFRTLDRDREALARRPVATATWDCPVSEHELLRATGLPVTGLDAIARRNAERIGVPPTATSGVEIVPLAGACHSGRLAGPVSFWLQLDSSTSDPKAPIQYSSHIVMQASLTLNGDKPASNVEIASLTTITHSNSPYLKASKEPGDGTLVVDWSSVAAGWKSAPGLQGLSVMRSGNSSPILVSRRETTPGRLETTVYNDKPMRIVDRYENDILMERVIGDIVRNYQAADGSWKTESLAARSPAAPAPAAAAREVATTPAGAAGSFNRIDGNSGRYLSPISSKGLPAAWVGRTDNSSGVGTTLGGMAGSYVGEKALQQVPFVGGLLGRKAGEAAARKMAQQAAGGDAYMRETSDISFNSIDDMAAWLVHHHASSPGFDVVLKAAIRVYPELNDAYLRARSTR